MLAFRLAFLLLFDLDIVIKVTNIEAKITTMVIKLKQESQNICQNSIPMAKVVYIAKALKF